MWPLAGWSTPARSSSLYARAEAPASALHAPPSSDRAGTPTWWGARRDHVGRDSIELAHNHVRAISEEAYYYAGVTFGLTSRAYPLPR
jgi:hypothetical protein